MTPNEALRVFGLGPTATWAEIRRSYRKRMRAVHPDVAPRATSDVATAAQLNAAYTVLARTHRHRAPPPDLLPDDSPDDPPDEGLVLVAPEGQVLACLAAALDSIGDLTYVDAESGYLQAMVDGGRCQLVVSVEAAAHGTQALFTLEPLGSTPAPDLASIVRRIAEIIGTRPG